jgi:hypothetical protein
MASQRPKTPSSRSGSCEGSMNLERQQRRAET